MVFSFDNGGAADLKVDYTGATFAFSKAEE
jgi:hypothetical protein